MKTFWDIYYWLTFWINEEKNIVPTYADIVKKFHDYDIEIVLKGINLYNDNYKNVISTKFIMCKGSSRTLTGRFWEWIVCDSSEYNKYDQLGFSRSNCTKYLSSEQKKYLLTDD